MGGKEERTPRRSSASRQEAPPPSAACQLDPSSVARAEMGKSAKLAGASHIPMSILSSLRPAGGPLSGCPRFPQVPRSRAYGCPSTQIRNPHSDSKPSVLPANLAEPGGLHFFSLVASAQGPIQSAASATHWRHGREETRTHTTETGETGETGSRLTLRGYIRGSGEHSALWGGFGGCPSQVLSIAPHTTAHRPCC